MNDLRVELQYGIPPFRIALPPGWRRKAASSETERSDLERAAQLFRQAGRPDLEAQYRAMMARVRQGMARSKVFAIFRQEEVEAEELLPMTITASAVDGEGGANLDGWISEAFRTRGADFLEDAKHIVRWEAESSAMPGGSDIGAVAGRTLTYVLPVPATNRARALVFTTTILTPDSAAISESAIRGMTVLSDLMISTVAWEQEALETAVATPAEGPTDTDEADADE
ncbi:hypothetical protein [Microbacterium sp. NPDC087591]|jgi:hypothetical protein|uniref:hypothetical protein n=1 Tax=Microbacterium sp. NPDC087591 TaxID=3364192 RepID=UPI003816C02A